MKKKSIELPPEIRQQFQETGRIGGKIGGAKGGSAKVPKGFAKLSKAKRKAVAKKAATARAAKRKERG